MSTPLPTGATSGATSYHDVCLDGQTPKAKGMTMSISRTYWRVCVIHKSSPDSESEGGGRGTGLVWLECHTHSVTQCHSGMYGMNLCHYDCLQRVGQCRPW